MTIICFIIYWLATMSSLGWHSPHLSDNTDTQYLGDEHWQQFGFLDFFLFCAYLCVHVSVCGSVHLYISVRFGSEHYLQQQSIPACFDGLVRSLVVLWNICFLPVQSSLVFPAWLWTTTSQYNCSTSDNISKCFNI